MALLEFEGFDALASPGLSGLVQLGSKIDPSGVTKWSASDGTGMTKSAPLSATGSSIASSGNTAMIYTSGNKTTLINGFRFSTNPIITNHIIAQFYDSGTVQIGLAINAAHQLFVFRGSTANVLATGSTVLIAGAIYMIEWKATFSGSVGAFEVRIGGVADIGPLTSQNTISTANAFANQCAFKFNGGTNTSFDDWYVLDDTGGVANTFIGNPRVETTFPNNAGTSAQFTPLALGYTFIPQNGSNSTSLAANTAYYFPITPAEGGTLTQVTMLLRASYAGNIKMGIFDSTGLGGAPGALLATSSTIISSPVGNTTLALAPPQNFTFAGTVLTPGTKYYIAVLLDSGSITNYWCTNSNVGTYSQPQTYASGFPATASGLTGSVASVMYLFSLTGFYTGVNASMVSEHDFDLDTSYNSSPSSGQIDTFGHAQMVGTPLTIFGVQISTYVKKDDVSAQSFRNKLISGATTQNGATHSTDIVANVYQRIVDQYVNDPNTSAQWLAAAVNATKIGYEHV
jgi:hypothetical protein